MKKLPFSACQKMLIFRACGYTEYSNHKCVGLKMKRVARNSAHVCTVHITDTYKVFYKLV